MTIDLKILPDELDKDHVITVMTNCLATILLATMTNHGKGLAPAWVEERGAIKLLAQEGLRFSKKVLLEQLRAEQFGLAEAIEILSSDEAPQGHEEVVRSLRKIKEVIQVLEKVS